MPEQTFEDPQKQVPRSIDPSTPFEALPAYLTVEQVCSYLRLAKNTVYDAIHAEILPSRRIGRQFRIPREELLGRSPEVKKAMPHDLNGGAQPVSAEAKLGEMLLERLDASGMTLREFAERCGVQEQRFAAFLAGAAWPELAEFQRLFRVVDELAQPEQENPLLRKLSELTGPPRKPRDEVVNAVRFVFGDERAAAADAISDMREEFKREKHDDDDSESN